MRVDKPPGYERVEGQQGVIDGLECAFVLAFFFITVISWVGISLAEFHLYEWKSLLTSTLLVCGAGGYRTLRVSVPRFGVRVDSAIRRLLVESP